MVRIIRFAWNEGSETRRFSLTFKWGDNIYELLLSKLRELGFIQGKKKLYYVDYAAESTLIHDNDSLWEAIDDARESGTNSIVRIETRVKPRLSEAERRSRKDDWESKNRKRLTSSSSRSRSPRSRSRSISSDKDAASATDEGYSKRKSARTHRVRSASRENMQRRLRRLEEKLDKLIEASKSHE
ncbi:unnamed protein product [Toxocara canis]|uniref:PB1 domain-containing protein n=1 Tax=Toxocara canis TaxID=6265 RepID=A0A183VA17_TOXCA|nr:unnamed protein product [Toxocara canis]